MKRKLLITSRFGRALVPSADKWEGLDVPYLALKCREEKQAYLKN